jgi:hypothetical protein
MTLDSGALIAVERGDRPTVRFIDAMLRKGWHLIVPAPVLTEVWRGGARQHHISRLLAGCSVEPLDEPLARAAGELLGRTGTADPVDAIVAQSAASRWRSSGSDVRTMSPRRADDLGTIRVRSA